MGGGSFKINTLKEPELKLKMKGTQVTEKNWMVWAPLLWDLELMQKRLCLGFLGTPRCLSASLRRQRMKRPPSQACQFFFSGWRPRWPWGFPQLPVPALVFSEVGELLSSLCISAQSEMVPGPQLLSTLSTKEAPPWPKSLFLIRDFWTLFMLDFYAKFLTKAKDSNA